MIRRRIRKKATHRRRCIALLVLTSVGGALSLWLVWIHYRLLASPDEGSACNFGGYLKHAERKP